MTRTKAAMVVAGGAGLTLFILLHFTEIFDHHKTLGAGAQFVVNLCVFLAYGYGYRYAESGGERYFGLVGMTVPVIMASITAWQVLL